MSVEVRLAREEDVGELVRLLGILFEQEAELVPEAATQRRGLISLIATPERARVLLAERAGRALGMVTLQVITSTATGGPVALVEDMVVEPAARGEGVGATLLGAAIEQAVSFDCHRLTLLTDADNVAAQRFYERHGLVRSTMVPMRLALSPR